METIMLSSIQQEQLLKPLNPNRVAQRKGGGGRSLSYLEAWDVKAHLTRVFGFGEWSWDVTAADLMYEEKGDRNWEVGYRVIGTLKIHATGATYTEAAVGGAALPQRSEAHDMAVKTGESDAIKRAAINLGDQFGLSLYNNGSTNAVVGKTLVSHETGELSETPVTSEPAAAPAEDTEGAEEWVNRLREAMNSGDVAAVVEIKTEMTAADVLDWTHDGKTLAKIADLAVIHAGRNSA